MPHAVHFSKKSYILAYEISVNACEITSQMATNLSSGCFQCYAVEQVI